MYATAGVETGEWPACPTAGRPDRQPAGELLLFVAHHQSAANHLEMKIKTFFFFFHFLPERL
jgi:hypothetical protein